MILEKIVNYKKEELEHFKRRIPFQELKDKARDARVPLSLSEALLNPRGSYAVIAEIKQRSPSKGVLRQNFDPVAIAQDYTAHGATALSVLTDEHFFGGHLDHMREVRQTVACPVLRKDFLWDPYQVYAALEAGADAILLIATILEQNQLEDLKGLAEGLGLSVLIEVYDAQEAGRVNTLNAKIVGVNNRDLRTFEVKLENSEQIFPMLSSAEVLISESGIHTKIDLERLTRAGAKAFLIGEHFMTADQPGKALAELIK